MKRLDIIFSDRELDTMLKALDEGGAPGYTVTKHVTGKGPQGAVSEDMEFTDLGANAHVIVFCDEKTIEKLRENVTSPGGVTQRAIEKLEKKGVKETINKAIEAATNKSKELGDN